MMGTLKGKQWGVRSKVWLELEGHPFMGEGRMAMLQAIHSHGSLIHASRETGISYRRIRGAIRDMEKTIGRTLVHTYRGGGGGGGAELTPIAHELMDSFKRVSTGIQQNTNTQFKKTFR